VSKPQVSVIVLPTGDLEESLKFYTETLGFPLVRRVSPNYAIVDGGSVALGLSASTDPATGGKTMLGMRTDDVDGLAKAIEEKSGGTIVPAPYDDGDERRAFACDNNGNFLMIYKR
jgi:catechol 2,3-dioxygenase-like lactoylglutathione lyase family enzyme